MTESLVRYPLATSTWDEAEYAALQEVIASGRFTIGPRVAQYESDFADFFGSRFAVMVNSGSSANLLAIAAAVLDPRVDLTAGDEVIVPAVSWPTTYYPLAQYGLRPKFIDIDLDTLNLDLDIVERNIGPETKAIFAVNLLGNPLDFVRLRQIAKKHDLVLLEDNCESLGASSDGINAGTAGLAGTFSSYFSHHISTMEGGIVVTDDEQLYQEMVSLRSHGWTRELPARNVVHEKDGRPWDDLFRFVLPGYNLRPIEFEGAVGVEQIKKIPAIIRGRRENAAYFTERLGDARWVRLQREVGESSWFGFSMVLEESLAGRREDVLRAFEQAGIESRPIVAGNFARNPVVDRLDALVPEPLRAADKVHSDGLFIGNHHHNVRDGIDLVADTLAAVARA